MGDVKLRPLADVGRLLTLFLFVDSLLNTRLAKVGVRWTPPSIGSDVDRPLVGPLPICLANRISSLARDSQLSRTEVLGALRMNFVPVSMSYVMIFSLLGSMS